jgi:chromosome segregation ATPase
MSRVYEALNQVSQQPFGSDSEAAPAPAQRDNAGIAGEFAELERTLMERIGGLRAAVDEREKNVVSDSQRKAQTIERLQYEVKALDARLKETTEMMDSKVRSAQATEGVLTAKINDLTSEVARKNEVLEHSAGEVAALRAEVQRLREGLNGIVAAFTQQAQALAGGALEVSRHGANQQSPVTPPKHPTGSANSAAGASGPNRGGRAYGFR